MGRRVLRSLWRDNCFGWAAQLAYYFFLSLFPALLFLVALASFFPVQHIADDIIAILSRFAPGEVLQIIRDQLHQIALGKNGGLLTIGILGTIWSTSSGMLAIIDTLNSAYHVQEARPWWRVRLTAIVLTVILATFIVVSFGLVLSGSTLAEWLSATIGFGPIFVVLWKILQWPVAAALVVAAVALVYYVAPDVKQQWFWILPGTMLAAVLWLAISLGFKWYVASFGHYNKTYGTIGGVIVLLLWFYLTGLVILVGAEVNAVVEHASDDGKNPGEKVPGENTAVTP